MRKHLGLVTQAVRALVARLPRHVARDELESAGMAGLARAARAFDGSRDIAFERFAMPRIRGALLDDLRQRDWASRTVRSRGRRLAGATDDLTSRLQRTPTSGELGSYLGVPTTTVTAVRDDLDRARVVLFGSISADDPELALPVCGDSPETLLLERERRSYLLDAVASLPHRLRRVVLGYFFEELTTHELADELGVCTSRISQMRTQALGMIREGMQANLDRDPAGPTGRTGDIGPVVARRRAAYLDAMAHRSTFHSRLATTPGLVAVS